VKHPISVKVQLKSQLENKQISGNIRQGNL
jgi:hypothetical protein